MFTISATWCDAGEHRTIFIHSQSLENGIQRYFCIESEYLRAKSGKDGIILV